jgi:hypothetical protein
MNAINKTNPPPVDLCPQKANRLTPVEPGVTLLPQICGPLQDIAREYLQTHRRVLGDAPVGVGLSDADLHVLALVNATLT